MQCLGMGEHVHKHLKKKVKIIYRGFVHKKPHGPVCTQGSAPHFPPCPTSDEHNPSFQPLLSSHLIHN